MKPALIDQARTAATAAGPAFYVPYMDRRGVGRLSDMDDLALRKLIRAARRPRHPGFTMLTVPLPVFDMPQCQAATMDTKALHAELRTVARNAHALAEYAARLHAEIARRETSAMR